MKERIAKSVFWMVWSKGGVQALSFLSTLIIARWLHPSDYGVMALVGIWTGTIGTLADMGLGAALVQFKDPEEAELNGCFWLAMAMTGSAYGVLYVLTPAIAGWFDSPRLAEVLPIASLGLLLVAVRMVPDAMLRKRLELHRIAQADIVAATIALPVMLGMAWNGAGVWTLVIGTVLQGLVQTLLVWWAFPWWPGFRVRAGRLRAMLRYSLSYVGASLTWSLYSHLDSLILGKLITEQALGLYSMAKQLALLPVTKIAVVINQLAFPVLAQLQEEQARLTASFLKLVRLVGSLTLPMGVGMIVVADDFIRVALGETWSPIVPLFRLFCFYALVHSFEVLLPPVLLARYRTEFLFLWTVGLLLVMPVPFALGASWYGALGVAWVWVVVYPFAMVIMAREALAELQIDWGAIWAQLRPILALSAVMLAAVWAVQAVLPAATTTERLVRVFAVSGIGAASYGAGLIWRGGVLSAEIGEVLGWLAGRHRVLTTAKSP